MQVNKEKVRALATGVIRRSNTMPNSNSRPEQHTDMCVYIRERLGLTTTNSNTKQDENSNNKSSKPELSSRWQMPVISVHINGRGRASSSQREGQEQHSHSSANQSHKPKENKTTRRSSTFLTLKNGQSNQCIKPLYINNKKVSESISKPSPNLINRTQRSREKLSEKFMKHIQKSPFKKPKLLLAEPTKVTAEKKTSILSGKRGSKIITNNTKIHKHSNHSLAVKKSKSQTKEKYPTNTNTNDANEANNFNTILNTPDVLPTAETTKELISTEIIPRTIDLRPCVITRSRFSSSNDMVREWSHERSRSHLSYCRHGIYNSAPQQRPANASLHSIAIQTTNVPSSERTVTNISNPVPSSANEEMENMRPGTSATLRYDEIKCSPEAKSYQESNAVPRPVKEPSPTRNVQMSDACIQYFDPTKSKLPSTHPKKKLTSTKNKSIKKPTSFQSIKLKWAHPLSGPTKPKSASTLPVHHTKITPTCLNSRTASRHSKVSVKSFINRRNTNRKETNTANKNPSTASTLTASSGAPHIKKKSKRPLYRSVYRQYSSLSFRSKPISSILKRGNAKFHSATPIHTRNTTVRTQTSGVVLTHTHPMPLCCLIWGPEDSHRRRMVPRGVSTARCRVNSARLVTSRKRKAFSANLMKRQRKLSGKTSFHEDRNSKLLRLISSTSMANSSPVASRPPSRVIVRGQDPPYAVRRRLLSRSASSLNNAPDSCPSFGTRLRFLYPPRPWGNEWPTYHRMVPMRAQSSCATNQTDNTSTIASTSSQQSTTYEKAQELKIKRKQNVRHWNITSGPHRRAQVSSDTLPWVAWTMRPKFSQAPVQDYTSPPSPPTPITPITPVTPAPPATAPIMSGRDRAYVLQNLGLPNYPLVREPSSPGNITLSRVRGSTDLTNPQKNSVNFEDYKWKKGRKEACKKHQS